MKFGPVPTAQAQGSVLAHSVALPEGRLRKGKMLDADDIAALLNSDINAIIVATLEHGDSGEDAAAEQLADALLAGSRGLRRSAAFTGRVNLIAQSEGVAMLDVSALHAVNAFDPMITVATVPPHHQLRRGDMVATIKIISYAVPQVAVSRAALAAQGAITVAPPILKTATLIITEIAGGAGEKGREAIESRLTALGVALSQVLIVPHTLGALAAAIRAAEAPLVLILTGSATSDIHDVAPSALVAAGGHVTRFGMPVDPGNLLFLGALGAAQVIGLPGCARSPALNGADWVLARIVCGVPVTAQDIAAMGVGGLLKEIPTRPQPRRPRSPAQQDITAD
ncbi:molybdopterin-binding protein [Sulfitobacter guttiformis]|uniref:Molybdenum cofactor cytidylyltransferase n=1 Tax=Sulfitobacter guttiformis TaxID=74349 RepID=A0A420DIK0_9RHOB|nr:molybdopterin-binding protein [Sulfitobacter guttiformis]KIN72159.1 Molybdopterin biosynthesis protein [Sulfitobacter guttiformis KCTC 32187]RKE94066.1 molybdenum cofactor cytidylyltransferase [Sulfitobacter guttiformis]